MFFYYYQESFLFHPRETSAAYVYDFDHPFVEKIYKTPYEGNIHTLHFKAEESKGLVYYLHGNAGSLRDWGWIYQEFIPLHYDVFLLDYRTYGKSTGALSEAKMHSDVAFIYQELLKEYKAENIVVWGRSIGTGMATQLAANQSCKALVLESPYYSIQDVAKKMAPIFPLSILLKYQFKNFEFLPKVSAPIYIIHGDNDQVIPFDSGKKLANVVGEKARFFEVKGGQHNDLSQFGEFGEMKDLVF